MIIVFGNQKGGAGKSTLATLCGNYLSLVKKRNVVVIDMDYQRSIYSRYEEEKILENETPYEVIELDLDKFPQVYPKLKEQKDTFVIIDLPGKLDDENLMPVLQHADVFIIPFSYDKQTYQSTTLFNLVTSKLNPEAKKFFVPNRIKGSVKYDTKEAVDKDFSEYGVITKSINDSVNFQRISTRDINISILPIIEEVYEQIFAELWTV